MIACGDKKFDLSKDCLLMGVLNITPDSFSDGGKYVSVQSAVLHALEMIHNGADVIDIGGESTNPYVSQPVDPKEELKRILPVIKELVKQGVRQISVDTRHAQTAYACLMEGASWINDVSGFTFDANMREASLNADAVILMHSRDIPQKMQKGRIEYGDVVNDVKSFLQGRVTYCESGGIPASKMIVDPGIGFGKALQHNIALIQGIGEFRDVAAGVLMGVSRKFFLGEITQIKDPAERDFATLGALAHCFLNGASILRVHNVKAAQQMLQVFRALMKKR